MEAGLTVGRSAVDAGASWMFPPAADPGVDWMVISTPDTGLITLAVIPVHEATVKIAASSTLARPVSRITNIPALSRTRFSGVEYDD